MRSSNVSPSDRKPTLGDPNFSPFRPQPEFSQCKALPPVRIRWPKVFYKPQLMTNTGTLEELNSEPQKFAENSFSSLCSEEERDEEIMEISAAVVKNEHGSEEMAVYDPENVGSYPPKPQSMLLFKDLKVMSSWDLEALQEDEDNRAQPEKVLETTGKESKTRKTTFALSLDLFDNPELELKHPSIDIKEVCTCRSKNDMNHSKLYI